MLRAGLFNFSKGELGPQLYGRVDVAAYSAALRKARNVIVLKYGGVTRRMGSHVAYELREPVAGWDDPSAAARLVAFEFSIEQTYALLLTQEQMRPLAFGGAVIEEELEILNITNAADAEIEAAFHNYAVGDEVYLIGIDGALGDQLNGRIALVSSVVDGDHFTIDIDTSSMAAFTGATGGTTRVADPAPVVPPPATPPVVDPPPPPVVWNPGFSFNLPF